MGSVRALSGAGGLLDDRIKKAFEPGETGVTGPAQNDAIEVPDYDPKYKGRWEPGKRDKIDRQPGFRTPGEIDPGKYRS